MSVPVFEAVNLSYSYPGGAPVLDDVSLTIHEGERVAILGANACGKSTLLHLLDGLSFPTHGRVSASGTVLTEESVETQPFCRLFRQRVGFVFQNSDAQLFCTSVAEELAFGPLQQRLPEAEAEKRVTDTLALFGIEHLRDRSPQTLSGGEKKRVALASVISCAPKVVLLDEPSAGLDPRTLQWLTEFVGLLNESGVTVVVTSHDLGFVAEITDRALILSEDHRLVYDGPVREALRDLDLLLSVNLIHAHSHIHDGEVHVHPHMHETWHDHEHPHGTGSS
jgi:cobalt/nickel transport system ATP-binding protein